MNTICCIFSFLELSSIFAYDDLSYNKLATQSHTFIGTRYLYVASNAVDGNISTCMRTKDIGSSSPDQTVWWKVDLGGVYSIYSINILFRNYDGYENRQRGRFAGFSLYISNTGDIQGSSLCYKDGLQLPPLNFTTTCTMYGRYVIFYNERLGGVTYPKDYQSYLVFTELCEVNVQGCEMHGMYGSFCNKNCPNNCKEVCHAQTGNCFICKPGWTGITCNSKCTRGLYGMNCSQQCTGHCRDGADCSHVTGQCDGGCEAGWTGSRCDKECKDGTFGNNCINNCSGHCLNDSPCNKLTGHCDWGCQPGYIDNYCSKECQQGHFGRNCRERCSGNCLNHEPCDHISGVCQSGCHDGYTGSLCNRSCHKGLYGRNCSHVCSPYCKICRHTDGLCTCTAGWTGPRCTEECFRFYGENCLHPCNKNCINQLCDRFNGTCLFGCLNGRACDITSQQNAESDSDDIYSTPWIIAFSMALVTSIIFIIATIRMWRMLMKRNSRRSGIQSGGVQKSGESPAGFADGVSNYQELNVSKEHSAYQTLELK